VTETPTLRHPKSKTKAKAKAKSSAKSSANAKTFGGRYRGIPPLRKKTRKDGAPIGQQSTTTLSFSAIC